jgi:hypothetical protein
MKWSEQPLGVKIILGYLGSLAIFVLAYALVSLRWQIEHDSPLLLYAGFLIEKFGYVPYRDFFEMNPPGTFLVNLGLFRLIGFSDLRFRIADLIWLTLLVILSWIYLRALTNSMVAVIGPTLFAITYLSYGQAQSMQREYIALLPIILSLVVAFRLKGRSTFVKAFFIGLLFGFTASIKPHLSIALPVILGGMILQDFDLPKEFTRQQGFWSIGQTISGAGLGFGGFLSIIFIYLLVSGALAEFLDIAIHYWPLYSQLSGDAQVRSVALENLQHLNLEALFDGIRSFRFYGLVPIGIACSLGLLGQSRTHRIEIGVLHLLAIFFLIYIWIGNKYWSYHHWPLFLILSFIAGFSFYPLAWDFQHHNQWIISVVGTAIFITIISLPVTLLWTEYENFFKGKKIIVKSGNVEQIVSFLNEKMHPDDRVVPLDVTNGAVHAMYLAQARLGSSFVYNFHFYHHCDSPYIQQLRQKLLRDFESIQPRFVIRFKHTWEPSGPGTCREFSELERVLKDQFAVVYAEQDFQILEHRGSGFVNVTPKASFTQKLRLVNPTDSPYVYAYLWNNGQTETYLLDDASHRGRAYDVEWTVTPKTILFQGAFQKKFSSIKTLSPDQFLAVAVSFSDSPARATQQIFERRFWFNLIGDDRLEVFLPAEEWRNPRWPDQSAWQMEDIDGVMIDREK